LSASCRKEKKKNYLKHIRVANNLPLSPPSFNADEHSKTSHSTSLSTSHRPCKASNYH
jgi:hypothetical protein